MSIIAASLKFIPKSALYFILATLLPGMVHADVTVVTSVRPLELIVRAIVGEHGQVGSLVDVRQSPHHYTMSPSDRIAIANAQILVWVDPGFEVYLDDVFGSRHDDKTVITLSALDGAVLHRSARAELDPHLWLHTGNALALARATATTATTIDPANTDFYRHNLDRFALEIERLNDRIRAQISAAPMPEYAVYHDAYRYFEEQFGLTHSFALLLNPDLEPTVQQLLRARRKFREAAPRCLMLEPDANAAVVETMLGDYAVARITMDLLGSEVTPDGDGYITLLDNLAASFRQCSQ